MADARREFHMETALNRQKRASEGKRERERKSDTEKKESALMSLHFSYETNHMKFGEHFQIFSHSIGIHHFNNIFVGVVFFLLVRMFDSLDKRQTS